MKRFKPLDVFRGMTIVLMIIVNTPGSWSSVYSPFLHASWHGFTPTDLVFPSFLFAVGNALAFTKQKWISNSFSSVFSKILKRTVIIFLLGYIMYWFPFVKWNEAGELIAFPIAETRIMGVLQRIAICYFIAAILIYNLSQRGLWIVSAICLLGYWFLMAVFGDYTMEYNFANYVDQLILGEKHLYHGEGIAFDPEGLLSSLPAVVNVLAGYLAGAFLIKGNINYEKITKLLLAGLAALVIAYIWNLSFPINKKLWTSSFVILTVGMDLVILGVLVFLMQMKTPKWEFSFFETFGKNPLFIYLLSQYLVIILWFIRIDGEALYTKIYQSGFAWIGARLGSLIFALTVLLICWLAARWLEKKKVYIKV